MNIQQVFNVGGVSQQTLQTIFQALEQMPYRLAAPAIAELQGNLNPQAAQQGATAGGDAAPEPAP